MKIALSLQEWIFFIPTVKYCPHSSGNNFLDLMTKDKVRVNLGVDIIDIDRVATAITRSGDKLLHRLLTDDERRELGDITHNCERVAGFWAAKEAAVKALGTGFRLGIAFHDIEVRHDELGRPFYFFSGEFARLMKARGLAQSTLSISHCRTHAIAAAAFS
ncbi:holo-ACP synthase [Serratia rubidaea]|nr:holo-ACP synthase [Serratia rubidaea]MDC6110882.1 holo-ACP synthase [Serratia rubidaea]